MRHRTAPKIARASATTAETRSGSRIAVIGLSRMASRTRGNTSGMAKNDDLFTTLRKHGLRKNVAQALAGAEGGGKKASAKAEARARDVLDDLGKASDAIRARVLDGGSRSTAGKKAAGTRKRNAAKRSAAARRAAETRKARATSH